MKRLLILLALLALVIPAAGLSLTFQDSSEFGAYVTCSGTAGGSCAWVQSATGGNNYIRVTGSGVPFSGGYYYLRNLDPSTTTYAGTTSTYIVGGGNPRIELYNSALASLYAYQWVGLGTQRCEVKMVGGVAKIYVNGKFIAQSGVLAQNPSYIGWGTTTTNHYGECIWDDIVYGTSENRNIFGSPEQGYFIKKDLINPAASGFYFPNGTIISSYNMTTTWGVGDSNESRTILLQNYGSAVNVGEYTTAAGTQAGSIAWPIYDDIINNPLAQYGYYVTTIAGSGEHSSVIPYLAYGASVAFNQDSYSRGDTATVTYEVDAGGYWDTATYAYRLDTLDIYGNVVDTQPVTMQTGSKSVVFAEDDPLGVYYSVLIATPIAGGDDIWMNFDYAELSGYLIFTGYVNDAETAATIPIANVSIGQGSTWFNYTTSADGNYTTTSAFYSGSSTLINITAAGYEQYTYTFTPLAAKIIGLNFTLVSSTPTTNGIGIGGVNRDTVYGRPIASVTDTITNTTFGESYAVTANSVGYYIADEDNGIFLTNGRLYCVSGSKTGYSTSGQYCLTVVAS